ncbi:MAG: hypothetical protein IIY21_10915 [Clostridiales bacterium]|nr:hypothetical protein [Clostridiales bacterium]MBQ1571181.1 hypothetical protein [Clostridiales bacterium]
MRWTLGAAQSVSKSDLREMSVKDLQSLDRFWSMTTSQRLSVLQLVPGKGNAERALEESGIIGVETDKRITIKGETRSRIEVKPEASNSKAALISHIEKQQKFSYNTTSTLKGKQEKWDKLRDEASKMNVGDINTLNVIEELQRRGMYDELVQKCKDTDTLIETIDSIIDDVMSEEFADENGDVFGVTIDDLVQRVIDQINTLEARKLQEDTGFRRYRG